MWSSSEYSTSVDFSCCFFSFSRTFASFTFSGVVSEVEPKLSAASIWIVKKTHFVFNFYNISFAIFMRTGTIKMSSSALAGTAGGKSSKNYVPSREQSTRGGEREENSIFFTQIIDFVCCERAYITEGKARVKSSQTLFDIPEMNCFLYSDDVPSTEKNFCLIFFGVWSMKARIREPFFSSSIFFLLRRALFARNFRISTLNFDKTSLY